MIGIFKSKRSAFAVLVITLAFGLVILGHLTGQAWADLVKWITIALVVGHTASGILAPTSATVTPAAVDATKAIGP